MKDSNPMIHRLIFLVAPKQELFRALEIESPEKHEFCRPFAVTTAEFHYEKNFETWKGMWKSKAKEVFIDTTIKVWAGSEINAFIEVLRGNGDYETCFDRFWTIQEIDHQEIDPSWRPWSNHRNP
jgi:hypothetical protein